MTINKLAWVITDGEHWADIDKILGYEVPDKMRKNEIMKALEEKFEKMSDKQLQKWINKYE